MADNTKIYREDDWIAEVEILEDTSDEDFERYTLKVKRTVRPSRLFRNLPEGSSFGAAKPRSFAAIGLWTLE